MRTSSNDEKQRDGTLVVAYKQDSHVEHLLANLETIEPMNFPPPLQDLLRVMYPRAPESELQQMLRIVAHKKKVKGSTQNVEQQIQELRDIFAV